MKKLINIFFILIHCCLFAGKDTPLQKTAPLIILDPGHGGTDDGTRYQSLLEKRMSLTTALLTKKQLNLMGYRVILTRSRDVFLSLQRRVAIANRNKAALFVSLHYNSSPRPEAEGIEIFFSQTGDPHRAQLSRKLANLVLYEMVDETSAISRGVKVGKFHVIRETEMPAILVEGGFLTNSHERAQLKTRAYLQQIALGVAKGIDKYLKG